MGQPVLSLPLKASLAPNCNDESHSFFMCDAEGALNIAGGLVELLTGFPDFEIFLYLDKGFM